MSNLFPEFPLPEVEETCWYCEQVSDELEKQEDGSWLCPSCKLLKCCERCGELVDKLQFSGNEELICDECYYKEVEGERVEVQV